MVSRCFPSLRRQPSTPTTTIFIHFLPKQDQREGREANPFSPRAAQKGALVSHPAVAAEVARTGSQSTRILVARPSSVLSHLLIQRYMKTKNRSTRKRFLQSTSTSGAEIRRPINQEGQIRPLKGGERTLVAS